MTTHQLHASQVVARPIEEVFAFFARAGEPRPDHAAGDGLRAALDDLEMRTGLEIDYRIRPLLGIPMRLAHADRGIRPARTPSSTSSCAGPYRSWEHRHTFTAVAGGTRIEDERRLRAAARAAR